MFFFSRTTHTKETGTSVREGSEVETNWDSDPSDFSRVGGVLDSLLKTR